MNYPNIANRCLKSHQIVKPEAEISPECKTGSGNRTWKQIFDLKV